MSLEQIKLVSLNIALVIFALGMAYRVLSWFARKVGVQAKDTSFPQRLGSAISGVVGTIFSAKLPKLLEALVMDGLLQRKVFQQDKMRWTAHICIYVGFMLLLIFHALQAVVSVDLFDNFNSTLNPFLFLRNLFGLVVLVGVGLAIYRRTKIPAAKRVTRSLDWAAIVILAVIMFSGILLEGAKIISSDMFMQMNADYGSLEGDELTALKAYWAENYSVVFPGEDLPTGDADVLAEGASLNSDSCAECHSKPSAAFMSYFTAQVMKPMAGWLSHNRGDLALLYIHFFACLLALIYLPFSKFLHIITTPLAMIVSRVMDESQASAANIATRRMLDLDACTHCGTCSAHCSVLASFMEQGNCDLLPSEKLADMRGLVQGQRLDDAAMWLLREGNDVCTRCHRCTDLCPAGINLQGLWIVLAEEMDSRGIPSTFVQAREEEAVKAEAEAGKLIELSPAGQGLALQTEKFRYCFECQTCSNACPVVAAYDDPVAELGMLPHQIMHGLGLGLVDQAIGARMTWNCLTCYKCQEQCPQGVSITDILYELKNMGYDRVKKDHGQAA